MMKKSRKLHPAPDDITSYYGWKKNIEENEIFEIDEREQKTETATDLSRRLSILPEAALPSRRQSTWSAYAPSDGFDNVQYKMPENSEITIINKWKEVEEADKDLENTREKYKEKMEEFNQRWRTLEKGQLDTKQKLVEFNNFVREKQGKVTRGKERVKLEKKAQKQKDVDLENLEKDTKVLVKAKDILEKSIDGKVIFRDYLESVAHSDADNYPDTQVLMMRCSALVDKRDNLRSHLDKLNKDIEHEDVSLEKFKEDKMKQTLEYNVRLVNLQQKASGLQAKTVERKTYRNNLNEKLAEKK